MSNSYQIHKLLTAFQLNQVLGCIQRSPTMLLRKYSFVTLFATSLACSAGNRAQWKSGVGRCVEIDDWENLQLPRPTSINAGIDYYNYYRNECFQGCRSRDFLMAAFVNGSSSRGRKCRCGHQESEER